MESKMFLEKDVNLLISNLDKFHTTKWEFVS